MILDTPTRSLVFWKGIMDSDGKILSNPRKTFITPPGKQELLG